MVTNPILSKYKLEARSVQSFSGETFRLVFYEIDIAYLFPNTSADPGLVLGFTACSERDLELTIVDRGLSDL